MAKAEKYDGLFEVSGVRGAEDPYSGGYEFLIYCQGARTRSAARRSGLRRAASLRRRAASVRGDLYPPSLLLAQRIAAGVSDLTRLLAGLEAAGRQEPAFDVLRSASIDRRDKLLDRLTTEADFRRELLRTAPPKPEHESEALTEALRCAYDITDARWLRQLEAAAETRDAVGRIGKASRHGTPMLSKPLFTDPPGLGQLEIASSPGPGEWVAVPNTHLDRDAAVATTTLHAIDVDETSLHRSLAGALDTLALCAELAEAHRLSIGGAQWLVPAKSLRKLSRAHLSELKSRGQQLDF